MSPTAPLIVSLQFDPATFAVVDALRRQHFPPDRNHLAAHITLFHHLPGDRHAEITGQLTATCAATAPLPLTLPSVRFLGRGVAINIGCDGLLRVRAELARVWRPWLTPQDQQGFRPHVTIQNKVDAATAKALYERLRATWTPLAGHGTGLSLWWYHGGPWGAAGTFQFTAVAT